MRLYCTRTFISIIIICLMTGVSFSAPLPVDIDAGYNVTRYFPEGRALVDGLKPFCLERKLESDLCSVGYAATIISEAMYKAGYSAKETIALISKTGYPGQVAYEPAGLGELTGPLISLIIIQGGPEYLLKYDMTTKEDLAIYSQKIAR